MHWFVWIGTLYIAFIVLVMAVLKKTITKQVPEIFGIHVFGNLLAFILVSLHLQAKSADHQHHFRS